VGLRIKMRSAALLWLFFKRAPAMKHVALTGVEPDSSEVPIRIEPAHSYPRPWDSEPF